MNAEIANVILVKGFQANISKLENVHYSINELENAVVDGFDELSYGMSRGFADVQHSLYQLHLDNIGTQAILPDTLSCILDKEDFKRELQRRRNAETADQRYRDAKNKYTDALQRTKEALIESNRGKASAMLDEALHLFIQASKENTRTGECPGRFLLGASRNNGKRQAQRKGRQIGLLDTSSRTRAVFFEPPVSSEASEK